MRSEPIAGYIFFGISWRFLQDTPEGVIVHRPGRILENLNAVLGGLTRFGLQVARRAATELFQLQDELKSTPSGATLTIDQAHKLHRAMNELQRVLQAESEGNLAYIVTDKRLDVRKLLGRPSELFAPSVFSNLPETAKSDFAEAGYCIAFERPTAAAFHILRGTEGVLRAFYCKRVKRNRVRPLLWGPMLGSLRRRRPPPPRQLLENLDNIRRSFRSPTEHPEKNYDIQEAQDLLSLCIDVVNRMRRSETWRTTV